MTAPVIEYRFPDAARTVAKLLEPLASPQRVGTRTPASLTGVMPFIRVTRRGGSSDEVNDYARIYIDVLATDVGAAELLSERIREFLTSRTHRLGRAVIDRVSVDSAPEELAPWSSGVFRFEGRYTVVSRRHKA